MKLIKGFALYLTVLLGVLLLAWMAYLAWHTAALVRGAKAAQALVSAGISPQTGLEAGALLRLSAPHARMIDAALRPILPFCDGLARVPSLRAASQLRPLLDLSSALLDAALAASRGLDPLLSTLSGQDKPDLSSLLRSLKNAQPDLASAETALARAQTIRATLDIDLLPAPLRARLSGPIGLLDDLLPQARGGLALLQIAPALAGLDQERDYLIAAQNNDEIRATGGFISAVGPIRLSDGKVIALDLVDSFAIDDFSKNYPPPPAAIQRFMLAGYWVPRDANWSPDFPQSAADLTGLYTLSTGIPVQGVIAFDQFFIASLTQILGPLQVEGTPETIIGDSVIEWMRLAWSASPGKDVSRDWWENRKNFIPALGRALIAAFYSGDFDRMTAASQAGYSALRQGHLLLWFADPSEQAALELAGLSGSIQPGAADYLHLVDSNIGFNKTDALVTRRLAYAVDLSNPAHPRAGLRADYTNSAARGLPCVHEARYGNSYADLMQRCYWDYWRVLAAPGSRLTAQKVAAIPPGLALLDPQGWPASVEQNPGPASTIEFSGLFLLPPASSDGYSLSWNLPPSVISPTAAGYRYTLRLGKQPGLPAFPVSLSIIPPQGCASAAAPPADLLLATAQTLRFDFTCPH